MISMGETIDVEPPDDPEEEKVIYIRCSKDTFEKFKEFAGPYEDYEVAIRECLQVHNNLPGYFNRRNG